MELKQITVVTGCILRDGKILLTQRAESELPEADRKWDLPGGKAEHGETTEEVVKREVFEEIGLEVEPLELIPYVHTNIWNYGSRSLHVIVMSYICTLKSGSASTKPHVSKISRVKWFDFGEINLKQTLPGIREFLEWVGARKLNVEIPKSKQNRRIYMECIRPELNQNKFYQISDLDMPNKSLSEQLSLFERSKRSQTEQHIPAFFLVRSYGRLGSTPRSTIEEYYSESTVTKRAKEILIEKLKGGYKIVNSNIGSSEGEVVSNLENQELSQGRSDRVLNLTGH